MKPGRELDALVAEKVMGRSKTVVLGYLTITRPVPHYSTDISAAWEIVEELSKRRAGPSNDLEFDDIHMWCDRRKLLHGSGVHTRYIATFDGLMEYNGEGETMAHAICLAALKILEVKDDLG